MAVIEIKNLGKKYKINQSQESYGSLRDSLNRVFSSPKNLFRRLKKEEFWALENINLDIEKGQAIGIIGANGAGKSTLLKILARITPPSTGFIKMQGRVAALLEVGTGFHQELTGRENIYLNGAIMGMGRKEIDQKIDKIIEFSGISKFIDTPVKKYSSGMSVRLGFSVAAHLDPDILIIDEVLAVGDAEFQKKCLHKMNEIIKNNGRTILFVSHNLEMVAGLCEKSVLMKKGRISEIGPTNEIISHYLNEKN